MQRIGDLLKELGFKKDSDEEVQKAFVRHLIKAAEVSKNQRQSMEIGQLPEQLSFDLGPSSSQLKPTDFIDLQRATRQKSVSTT